MRCLIIFIILLFFPFTIAETTFFDNPDDSFIIGNSTTSITGGTIIDEGQQEGGCTYKWNCTNWEGCLPSEKQIRSCTNIGTCSNTYKTPQNEQTCIYNASKNEGETKKLENENESAAKNRLFLYIIIFLVILFIIFYLKKNYFKKLIKK